MAGNPQHRKKLRQVLQNRQLKIIKGPCLVPFLYLNLSQSSFNLTASPAFILEAFTPSRGEQVTDRSLKRSLHDSLLCLLLILCPLLCYCGLVVYDCLSVCAIHFVSFSLLLCLFPPFSLLPCASTPGRNLQKNSRKTVPSFAVHKGSYSVF